MLEAICIFSDKINTGKMIAKCFTLFIVNFHKNEVYACTPLTVL